MATNSTTADFEVGIIGGGPGGAAAASYLAKAGISCAVFERKMFPRPHIGESFVPATTRVFSELGFLEEMDKAGFPRKYGAVWTTTEDRPVYFNDYESDDFTDILFAERKQDGVHQNYTYHVDRGRFDLMFLQHANKLGATVYQGMGISRVDFDGELPRIYFKIGGKEMFVTVKMVIDASGRDAMLGSQLGYRVKDSVFNQFAYHTWFEDYDRAHPKHPNKQEYIFVHFLPITNSWIWQIPITETITSIGIVTQNVHFPKTKEGREKWFWDTVATRPDISEKLKVSKQVRPFKEECDYSYAMKQICGDRWALIGDAGRFVDPIFSSGVSIAMNGARLLCADIIKAHEAGGDYSRASFAKFEQTLRWGTRNWYDFITLYYRLNILFTIFIKDPKYRTDILKLLQGDVYDEETPQVLREMKNVVASVESNPKHPLHKMLGDLTCAEFKPSF